MNTTQRTRNASDIAAACKQGLASRPKADAALAFGFKGACELSKSKSNPSELGLPFRHDGRARVFSGSTVAGVLKDSAPSNRIGGAAPRQGLRKKTAAEFRLQ
jgi:hypothetical protein